MPSPVVRQEELIVTDHKEFFDCLGHEVNDEAVQILDKLLKGTPKV